MADNDFVQKMKDLQASLGLNQADFAEWLGVSQSTISRLYAGERGAGRKLISAVKRRCSGLMDSLLIFWTPI